MLARIDERMRALEITEDTVVCKRAGLNKDHLNNLRRDGGGREAGVFYAAALARALECSIDYLAGESDVAAVPLDNDRLVRIVEVIIRMIQAKTLMLEPDAAARLVLHVYNDPTTRGDDMSAISTAVIAWLSGSLHRSD